MTFILAGLTEMETRTISALAERREASAGSVIVRQGEASDELFIIVSGEAEVRQKTALGEDLHLRQLQPGDAFGEFALLTRVPRSATVIASTTVDLLCLNRTGVMSLRENAPAIAAQLLWNLSRRLCEQAMEREGHPERLGFW